MLASSRRFIITLSGVSFPFTFLANAFLPHIPHVPVMILSTPEAILLSTFNTLLYSRFKTRLLSRSKELLPSIPKALLLYINIHQHDQHVRSFMKTGG